MAGILQAKVLWHLAMSALATELLQSIFLFADADAVLPKPVCHTARMSAGEWGQLAPQSGPLLCWRCSIWCLTPIAYSTGRLAARKSGEATPSKASAKDGEPLNSPARSLTCSYRSIGPVTGPWVLYAIGCHWISPIPFIIYKDFLQLYFIRRIILH